MSGRGSPQFQPEYVEQDYAISKGGDELPTYDDLAEQGGPNSRFGRWRGWIEKRAAERYAEITPEVRRARRKRGWGNDDPALQSVVLPDNNGLNPLQIETQNLTIAETSSSLHPSVSPLPPPVESPLPPLPFISRRIRPTHLKINHFGSRFLPHSTSPIRCVLPLLASRLLLLGTDEGLSVLDMYPQEWTDGGQIAMKGPDEAHSRQIWVGESVHQLCLLEVEEETLAGTTPSGVVLALVGSEVTSKESETSRTLRMYNLASLISLAKWAVSSKGAKALEMHSRAPTQGSVSPKRHKHHGSFARGLRSLLETQKDEGSSSLKNSRQKHRSSISSHHRLLSPAIDLPAPSSVKGKKKSRSPSPLREPTRQTSADSWDMVDDLPLRWATDYVSLATPSSRLASINVLSFALYGGERGDKSDRLLAVATKNNILLYETPRGERAFHFLKEFYTPLQPRTVTFFQQSVQDPVSHSSGPSSPTKHGRQSSWPNGAPSNPNGTLPSLYPPQLALFVTFEKKSGWIRIADSAVGEIELYDDGANSIASLPLSSNHNLSHSGGSFRASRISLEGISFGSASRWIAPTKIELPILGQNRPGGLPAAPRSSRKVHILTKGQTTHIVPCPLASMSQYYPPLRVVKWRAGAPGHVSARLCEYSDPYGDYGYGGEGTYQVPESDGDEPFLQLVGFGEAGVEVIEIGLDFLRSPSSARVKTSFPSPDSKSKGKAVATSPGNSPTSSSHMHSVSAVEDLNGAAGCGYLGPGGHWDNPHMSYHMSSLVSRASSTYDGESMFESNDGFLEKVKKEEGMYGWVRKGVEDYRVFWVGGSLDVEDEEWDGDDGDDDLDI